MTVLRLAITRARADLRRVMSVGVAIVLGVGFFTATLVLGDTMSTGFADAFETANDGTAVVVRHTERLGNDESAADTGTVPLALVDQVRSLPGVAAAEPVVEGLAQIVAADGTPLGGDGPPTMAANWVDDERLSPWRIAAGRAPRTPGEVVVDRASARRGDLPVGSTVVVRTPDPIEATVVGHATFAGEDSLGPTTQVLWTTEEARRRLLPTRGDAVTSIRVAAEPGVGDDELVAQIASVLPSELEAITGTALAEEQYAALESDFMAFFRALLLAFAGIGLLVGTLTIHNTLSIVVAQRAREAGLLRALGASARQVLTAVAVEAMAVGMLASAFGVAAGVGLGHLALAGMDAGGFGTPGAMVVSGGAVLVALAVGALVTLAASLGPALTAARVAPLAALRSVEARHDTVTRRRMIVAVGVGLTGGALALGSDDPALIGLGAAAVLVAGLAAAPVLVRTVLAVLGAPLPRLRGVTGVVARRNAVRSPRRVARAATALVVGVGVVVCFTVLASSLRAHVDQAVDRSITADLAVLTDGFSGPGLSSGLAPELGELAAVADAVPFGAAALTVDGSPRTPSVADLAAVEAVTDLGILAGDLQGDEPAVAVAESLAHELGWEVGQRVVVGVLEGGSVELDVAAVYAERDLVGDLVVSRMALEQRGATIREHAVLVALAEDADPVAAKEAITGVTNAHAAPAPLDREELAAEVSGEVDSALAVLYALLAVAIVIAVLGIGNTMSLSIHERTRELGLLRAVGMTRGAIRAAVRWESALVAGFGATVGTALGVAGAMLAIDAAERSQSMALDTVIPTGQLVVIVGLGIVAGIVAAARPARRAARLAVLDAIRVT